MSSCQYLHEQHANTVLTDECDVKAESLLRHPLVTSAQVTKAMMSSQDCGLHFSTCRCFYSRK